MDLTKKESTETPSMAPWYALRTFNCQEKKVSQFLSKHNCIHFIPMAMQMSKTDPQKTELVPAIHNLVFIQKNGSPKEIQQMLSECCIPVRIFRQPGQTDFCEIPHREMLELRMLCDPQFSTSVYLTPDEADLMVGKEVRVVAGPFKGSTGRLVRKNKKFYFLKTFIGMGIMLRISRWYCKPI